MKTETKTQDQLDDEQIARDLDKSIKENMGVGDEELEEGELSIDDQIEDLEEELENKDQESEDEETEEDEDDQTEETDDDEEVDEPVALSPAQRKLFVRTLKRAGATPDAIVRLNDKDLARAAEAFAEEGEDIADNDSAASSSQELQDAMASVTEKLGDDEGQAIQKVFDLLLKRTERAEENAAEAADTSRAFLRSSEDEAFERVRVSLQKEIPSLAKPAVVKKLRQKMLSLAKTGDYSEAGDLSNLAKDAAKLLDLDKQQRSKDRTRGRVKADSNLRKRGTPDTRRRRSRRRGGGLTDDEKVDADFIASVKKHRNSL